ncbi:hypothetical protein ACFYU5_34750 [Nocardia aobensis]|uniref:Uncharacterized protein n=1 Tax=Nocardia aobensis TaxID=257277 RepID=A0ABW6PER5_9NOCA|nr:hypothetical protein [Nocardia elegans]
MDPLVIACHFGEAVDARLIDEDPIRGPEHSADCTAQAFRAVDRQWS